MKTESFSHRTAKKHFDFSEKKLDMARIKRQKAKTSDFLNCFAPKRYPRIFLDQRLRSHFINII